MLKLWDAEIKNGNEGSCRYHHEDHGYEGDESRLRDILLLDLHEQVFWQTSKNWYNLMVIKDY